MAHMEPLFSVAPVLLKVDDELNQSKHSSQSLLMLQDARAYLLCMEEKFGEALRVFTDNPHKRTTLNFDVFKLIEERDLFESVLGQQAIFALLKTHEEKVSISALVMVGKMSSTQIEHIHYSKCLVSCQFFVWDWVSNFMNMLLGHKSARQTYSAL